MTETTVLDLAHAAMEAAPEDDGARLTFYGRLAETELFLLLAGEAGGADVAPAIFELSSGRFVMAFDSDERLAAFADAPAPYAAMPGRAVARALAGRGIGLALNLGVAPSAFVMPPEAVEWLAGTAGAAPTAAEARPVAFAPPTGLPTRTLAALDARLARMAGLADGAILALATYEGEEPRALLAILGPAPGAEETLARAVAEAVSFSGEAAGIDVTFLAPGDPVIARLAACGLRFDIPEPDAPAPLTPAAPGTDPDRPPRLR